MAYVFLTGEDAELVERVTEYVRASWELREAPAFEADLVSRLNRLDPEEFGYFLEAFSRTFSVEIPGQVRLETLTIRDLCAYAKVGAWPRQL